MRRFSHAVIAVIAVALVAWPVFAGATVVEEIVARVNNDIITLSDYQKALAGLPDEVQQECQGCPPDKVNAMLADERKNLLSNLIDKSLLVQRAKDLGISVETDVVKQLNQLRIQNNLPSMDALQKAVEAQGMNWEDYRQELADTLLTQEVIQREVGSQVKIDNEEILSYYNAHKSDYVKPEEVDLSEIYFKTEGKTPQEAAAIEQKAEGVLKRLQAGQDFGALATRFSDLPMAAANNGELGLFKRGELTPDLEKMVFAMKKGDITDLIHASTGLEIFRVNQHYSAGLQPLSVVENDIENHLYSKKIQAALSQYYERLRRDSYVVVRAGYVDTGAVPGNNAVFESAPPSIPAPTPKKSKKGDG